jgi:hypothetical protein
MVRFSSTWLSVGASRVSHVMLQGHRWVAIVIANDENIKFFLLSSYAYDEIVHIHL